MYTKNSINTLNKAVSGAKSQNIKRSLLGILRGVMTPVTPMIYDPEKQRTQMHVDSDDNDQWL